MFTLWRVLAARSTVNTAKRHKGNIGNYGEGVIVSVNEAKSFMKRCMVAIGTSDRHADALADNLVTADHRGHFSHGLNRIEIYVSDMKSGLCVSDREPSVSNERAATAYVDGHHLLGPVVGNFCMDLAIKKAKEAGVGWVVAKDSNHYGIAGYYSMQASDQGMIGMSFTNTSPLVIPTRSRDKLIGTNPIAVAAPGVDGDCFSLDMATSTVALGKIELASVKQSSIPEGWGADSSGVVTNKPDDVLTGGGQLPLGGTEETSGYKGYGLGMMVEIFCGILGNAKYGPNIRTWKDNTSLAHLGQCFVAIDPEAFAPGFAERMQDMMDTCRNSTLASGEEEVLVAGDPERQHISLCDTQGGIKYHHNQMAKSKRLAEELGVEPMVPVK